MLSITVFLTPDGSVDEGGVPQPAYLNFNAQLLGPPAAGMKGIIGEGYERMLAKSKTTGFAGNEEDYRMARYFDTNHLHNRSATVSLSSGSLHCCARLLACCYMHARTLQCAACWLEAACMVRQWRTLQHRPPCMHGITPGAS